MADLTTTFLGPYCTHLMAQMGAEVLKIESPLGDITRSNSDRDDPKMARSLALNRGKKSIVLDLTKPSARRALGRITETSDVFVHNMRGTAATKLGIDYDSVAVWNPQVVYCAAAGFGRGGPYSEHPAYDDIIQAVSGLASVQGTTDDGPRYVNSIIADKTCGLTALYGILAALVHRERTGEGQAVTIPMFETMVAFLLVDHMGGMGIEPPAGPPGYLRLLSEYRRPYRTADGYIGVLAYSNDQWKRFAGLVGRPELAVGELATSAGRLRRIDVVYCLVSEFVGGKTTEECLALFAESDVPAARVNTIDDLFTDPHLEAVKFFEIHSDGGGNDPIRNMAPATQFSVSGSAPMAATPALGEHSVEVLQSVGVGELELREMISQGATVDGRLR